MIGFVRGDVAEVFTDRVILDCMGIGYNIFVPTAVSNCLNVGEEDVRLFTYLSVKADSMNLYGFNSKDDLEVFKMLINVSGIGPKGALSILSVMTVNDLRMAVVSEDAKIISKTPGIGIKTAQKVIIELKDKMKFEDVNITSSNVTITDNNTNEAVMALISLGYSQTESINAVKKCNISTEDMAVEDIIKEALRKLI
ncbi:MAG: Holliday junction branch migration protein RuvA [Clostridiales bacterium]|nr:Holliday junction branch migration protein RuvA [Clostridiales bacterium]